ncbi:MAG: IS110 family transposase [Burkholderiaceae bacterium]
MDPLGIDVSKAKLDCCLLAAGKPHHKAVLNSAAGLAALLAWLTRQHAPVAATHAVLEPTGPYHELAATALHDAGLAVSLVNPAQARAFARSQGRVLKNDRVDAEVLARFALACRAAGQPLRTWSPLPAAVRHLKALLARRDCLKQDHQRELNRREKACAGPLPAIVADSHDQLLTLLAQQIARIEREIEQHIDQDPDLHEQVGLLQSIPGIGPVSSSKIGAVFAAHPFTSCAQAAAYAGIVPVERTSGSSLRCPSHISKRGSADLRRALYFPAIVATTHNPVVHVFYQRLLTRGMAKKAAIVACMRKLLQICFGVLRSRQPFDPLWSERFH